ncbi:MAG TPA: DUF5305 family protein [Nocardioidaceae bacterium]|nr:DUF5305 family protein [Nocardioidaceae bacterium]
MTAPGMTQREANRADATAPAFSRLESLTAVVVVGVLALALGLVALARPTNVQDKKSVGYTQSGKFGYSANAPTGSLYGPNGLTTGAPILTKVVGPVTARFTYKMDTEAAADVHGTAALVAKVTLGQGLSRRFPVAAEKSFTGTKTTVSGRLPVKAIKGYVNKALASLGETGGLNSATVTLQPKIQVRGSLASHQLKAAYSPALTFALSSNTLTVGQGASADPTSQTANDPLKPSKKGKVGYKATVVNTVPLLVVHPSVMLAREIGFGLAALCLLLALLLARPLLRDDPEHEPAKIRTLYGSHIVEVSDLSAHEGPVAQVASIESLADLAKKYESMIMHVHRPEGEAYLVWDNGMTYQYQPATQPESGADAAAAAEAEAGKVLTRTKTKKLNGVPHR